MRCIGVADVTEHSEKTPLLPFVVGTVPPTNHSGSVTVHHEYVTMRMFGTTETLKVTPHER